MNFSIRTLVNTCVLILVGFAMGMVATRWKFEQVGQNTLRPPLRQGPGLRGGNHEKRMLKMFTQRLDLNEEQQAKVKSILASGDKRLKALHAETFPKFEVIRKEITSQLRGVLTGEQIEKFDQLPRDTLRRPPPRPQRPPRAPRRK